MKPAGLALAFSTVILIPALDAAEPQSVRTNLVPSITVVGTGEVRARPDTAQINVGVMTEATSAAEAVHANNQAMNQLLATLKEQGIEEKYILTSGFNVSPKYMYGRRGEQEPPEIAGYTVSNQVQITVRNLGSLGVVLDKVVRAGANQIHGIGFTIYDPTSVLDEARRKAVDDARRKAKLYAEAGGVELGRLLLIQEAQPSIPEPMFRGGMRMAAAEMASPVPIATGEQTLSASVTLTFAFKEGQDAE